MRSRVTGAVWAFVLVGVLVTALAYAVAFVADDLAQEPASSGPSMVGGMGDAGGRRGSGGGVR